MVSNRRKICFGLLLPFFIIFGSFLGVFSKDVSAVSMAYTGFGVYTSNWQQCSTWQYVGDLAWYENFSACGIRSFVADSTDVQATGQYWSVTGKFNVVRRRIISRTTGMDSHSFVNLHVMNVLRASHNGNALTIDDSSIQTFITNWEASPTEKYQTLTIQYTASGHGAVYGVGKIRIVIGSDYYSFLWPNGSEPYTNAVVYFQEAGQSPTSSFAGSFDDGSSQTIINQNNTLINQNDQYYQHEYAGENNIANQQASDIEGAENQQTTNIIGFISSFVAALQNVQASDCTLTLPFPVFAGGTYTANICDGKQYAPTIISVAGSLLLIGTFVPLAFILLRMIYNEIRSWTNG